MALLITTIKILYNIALLTIITVILIDRQHAQYSLSDNHNINITPHDPPASKHRQHSSFSS
eukprot:scaffold26458_cov89-Skeletonema_dohrnii-CCMP3373.AAC.1